MVYQGLDLVKEGPIPPYPPGKNSTNNINTRLFRKFVRFDGIWNKFDGLLLIKMISDEI